MNVPNARYARADPPPMRPGVNVQHALRIVAWMVLAYGLGSHSLPPLHTTLGWRPIALISAILPPFGLPPIVVSVGLSLLAISIPSTACVARWWARASLLIAWPVALVGGLDFAIRQGWIADPLRMHDGFTVFDALAFTLAMAAWIGIVAIHRVSLGWPRWLAINGYVVGLMFAVVGVTVLRWLESTNADASLADEFALGLMRFGQVVMVAAIAPLLFDRPRVVVEAAAG